MCSSISQNICTRVKEEIYPNILRFYFIQEHLFPFDKQKF